MDANKFTGTKIHKCLVGIHVNVFRIYGFFHDWLHTIKCFPLFIKIETNRKIYDFTTILKYKDIQILRLLKGVNRGKFMIIL